MDKSTRAFPAPMPGSAVAAPRELNTFARAVKHTPQINWVKRIDRRSIQDRHGLKDGAPLAFAMYTVAVEFHQPLKDRTLGQDAVLQHLRKLAPASAFQHNYVAQQAFKLINPHGHGANSPRFNGEVLGWFRQEYKEDRHLTSGFILFLCAAKWWTHEQGRRSVTSRMNPLTTSDLDGKLKSYGFLVGEREAICRVLRRRQS